MWSGDAQYETGSPEDWVVAWVEHARVAMMSTKGILAVHDQNVEVNVVAIVAEIVIGAGVIARENDPAVVIEETETGIAETVTVTVTVIETVVADEIEDFKIDLWHTIVYQKKIGKTQGARRDCDKNASLGRFLVADD
jgi:hypothetical protein